MQFSLKFIDTEQFQRLQDLKQLDKPLNLVFEKEISLAFCICFEYSFFFQEINIISHIISTGLSDMVYPGAVHSRFEHSLGVYWLAGNAVEKLKAHQVTITS